MEKVSHLSCGELTQNAVDGDASLPSSENPDIFEIVLQQSQEGGNVSENRPRQYGRRSNPMRISSMVVPESLNHTAAVNIKFFPSNYHFFVVLCSHMHAKSLLTCGNLFSHFIQRIIAHHQERPSSAPVAAAATTPHMTTSSQRNAHRPRQSLPSEPSSVASSRNSSPVSMVSSTGSSSLPDAVDTDIRPRFNAHTSLEDDDERDQNDNEDESKTSWPHLLSRPICCVFCTLGLFNISRFAIFSVHFGGNITFN
jgi:hypothetical protein